MENIGSVAERSDATGEREMRCAGEEKVKAARAQMRARPEATRGAAQRVL